MEGSTIAGCLSGGGAGVGPATTRDSMIGSSNDRDDCDGICGAGSASTGSALITGVGVESAEAGVPETGRALLTSGS